MVFKDRNDIVLTVKRISDTFYGIKVMVTLNQFDGIISRLEKRPDIGLINIQLQSYGILERNEYKLDLGYIDYYQYYIT